MAITDPAVDQSILERAGYGGEEGVILLLRVQLIRAIKAEVERRGWSQNEAARFLGVKQPRLSEIAQLRIDKFSVEKLAKISYRLGLRVSLSISTSAKNS